MNREKGMTLVELMVSLSIIMIIMAVATTAYLKILRSYKTQSKISQSYMANLTGLELLRYDIEMAGFGLPGSLWPGTTYSEAVAPGLGVLPTSYNPTALNDSTTAVPRPLVISPNGGRNGSDVLAIKSAVAGINSTSRKWSMIWWDGTVWRVKAWGGASLDAASDFTANDRFIVLDDAGALMPSSAGTFSFYTFVGTTPTSGYYTNANAIALAAGLDNRTVYFLHGLDAGATHRMPFNRVDYYLDTVTTPNSCAANTYTLYRSVINQTDGLQANPTPLIDCVRDFQVAFGLDTDADKSVDTNGWRASVTGMDGATMKAQVREIRVFILYHEGTGDAGKSPDFRFSGILNLGDPEIARSLDNTYPVPNTFQTLSAAALSGAPQLSSFTPAGTDTRYRWKVLELAVKPMNLK